MPQSDPGPEMDPRCPGIGADSPDHGQIGIPDFPIPGKIGNRGKIPNIFPMMDPIPQPSRPNWDRENPGYFPGQIGAGRGGTRNREFRGLATVKFRELQ
jgi:hypothetical protein